MLTITLIPIGDAAVPTTQTYTSVFGALTDLEKDYVQSYTGEAGRTTTPSCSSGASATPTDQSVLQGRSYYILTGTTGASTITVAATSAGNLYSFSSATPSSITVLNTAWNPVLVWSETGASTTGNTFVKITVPASASNQTLTYTCTGSATKNSWSLLNMHRAGTYTYFRTSSTINGVVVNETLTQGSEIGYFASQITTNNFAATANCPITITNTGTFHYNLTPSDGGVSSYLFVQEFINTSYTDVAHDYSFSSTLGGSAIPIQMISLEGSPPSILTAWRLWHTGDYWNTTLTNGAVLDTSDLRSGNTLRSCVFESTTTGIGNTGQPNSPNVNIFLPPLQSSAWFTEIWGTDDYNVEITFNVQQCLSSLCVIFTDPLPNAIIVIQELNGPFLTSTETDSNGFATISGSQYWGKTLNVSVLKSGYRQQNWYLTIPQLSGSFNYEIGAPLSPSSAGSAVPTGCLVITPPYGNFLIPAAANHTINDCSPNEQRFASVFQQLNNTGVVVLRQGPSLLVSPVAGSGNYASTYPTIGYTRSANPSDLGSYAIVISNGASQIVGKAPFIIRTASFTPPYMNVNDSLILGAFVDQLTPKTIDLTARQQEQQATDFLDQFTVFAFGTVFFIPNMYLFLIGALLVAVLMAGARRRMEE